MGRDEYLSTEDEWLRSDLPRKEKKKRRSSLEEKSQVKEDFPGLWGCTTHTRFSVEFLRKKR